MAKGPKIKKKRLRRSPEEARTLILAAARRVFAERGPDAAGLKDVAVEAGVSHGLVTHYFGTFDDLVEAAMELHMTELRHKLIARLAGQESLSPPLFVQAAFDVLNDPVYGRFIAWALLSGRYESASFFSRRQQGSRQIVDVLESRLEAGGHTVDRGELEGLLLMVLTSSIGYGMAKSLLWESLGQKPTKARDVAFSSLLGEMVASRLS